MSILIDSGETTDVPTGNFSHPFFKPIDRICGNYKDHNNVLQQFLKGEDDSTFSLAYSGVSGSDIFGIALSITKEEFASDGDLITSYKVKKEIIKKGEVENYTANHKSVPNQVGPTLLLTKEHLEFNSTLSQYQFHCRIGKYDDGRYVLFLHSEDSEVNNPVRIPSE